MLTVLVYINKNNKKLMQIWFKYDKLLLYYLEIHLTCSCINIWCKIRFIWYAMSNICDEAITIVTRAWHGDNSGGLRH